MNSWEDFWEQVYQTPADDTPRLLWADWLEEQGDPYGEFIRLGVQIPTDPEQSIIQIQRLLELWQLYHRKWLQPYIQLGWIQPRKSAYQEIFKPFTLFYYDYRSREATSRSVFPTVSVKRGVIEQLVIPAQYQPKETPFFVGAMPTFGLLINCPLHDLLLQQ